MNDLDTLRPEVRDALASIQGEADCRCSEPYKSRGMKDPQCNHDLQDSVDVVRAELLRLTDDCARLVVCINAQPPTRRSLIDRAERAEAELATAQNTINAQQDTMGALKRKLALSEAERAAVKARIADAPIATLVYGQADMLSVLSAETADDWAGKTVRLVVEE